MRTEVLGNSRFSGWKLRTAAVAAVLGVAVGVGVGISSLASAGNSSGPTFGTIPSDAFGSGRGLDMTKVPDFVQTIDSSTGQVVGYVRKQDLVPPGPSHSSNPASPADSKFRSPTASDQAAQAQAAIMVVYGPDLRTVVGHMYPGVGFVALGQAVPDRRDSATTVVSGP